MLIAKWAGGAVLGALVCFAVYDWWDRHQEIRESDRLLASIGRRVVAVDAQLYESYSGRYQIEDGFSIAMTHEDGRLFAQGTNQVKVEIFPASQTIFFNEITNALIAFESGLKGRLKASW